MVDRLGRLSRDLSAARVLVISDPGVVAAGHVERAVTSLEEAGLVVHVYSGVDENPSTAHVEEASDAARRAEIDLLIGLGGGSAMDVAKGVNFLVSNGGRMQDYRGLGKARLPMLPSIGVPTTAGTGSEAQSFALIADADSHEKMACGDDKARFTTVVLDPELTATAPLHVRAVAGMDALGHAVESLVATTANPISRLFSIDAFLRLDRSFERSLRHDAAAEVTADMMLGAYLAGCAIEGSMLGAAHACANPLTTRFGVAHGVAVALMLPHVVRFNGPEVGARYADLLGGGAAGRPTEVLASRLESLREAGNLPRSLEQCGVTEGEIAAMAADAALQWTAAHNPRPVGADQLASLYRAAW